MYISIVNAATFTRPNDTTAYASGDLVANSGTNTSVTPLVFNIPNRRSCIVRGARIVKSGATLTNGTFTLHLFQDSPTVANGDNAALSTTASRKIGSIDLDLMASGTDDGISTKFAGNFYVDSGSAQQIYGLLEAKAAYTPAAQETFTVSIIVEQ